MSRSDMQLNIAIVDYECFIERKVMDIETLLVHKDPESLNRLSGLRAQLDHAANDPKGDLHSMQDDLKQALIRGRALENVTG